MSLENDCYYGKIQIDNIKNNRECPIGLDSYSAHPLGMYCLYGSSYNGIPKCQYFNTDSLYKWVKICKEHKKIPTNPLTRKEISQRVINRLNKYYKYKKNTPTLTRDQSQYYFFRLKNLVKNNLYSENNYVYESSIDANTFQLDFLRECSKDKNINNLINCKKYREASKIILEKFPINTWLVRPSSLIGNSNIIPIVITIKESNRLNHVIIYQRRGVGIVGPTTEDINSGKIIRGANISKNKFIPKKDLFLEYINSSKLSLVNYFNFVL